jgi:RecA/RadA recombinase
MPKKEVDQIKSSSSKKILEEPVEFFTTGSTILNLAGSGKGAKGGWARGRIANIVGDGSSGKTMLALETCANAFFNIKNVKSSIYPPVNDIQIVYNNVERVMDFPLAQMYGKKFVDGVDWIGTKLIEDFTGDFVKRIRALKKGQFLLYVVDSWDALQTKAGQKKFEEALAHDEKTKGSYGTDKAKYASSTFFNNICDMMSDKDVSLIIISQIRQDINAMFGDGLYRAGGKALDFYTHQVVWLAQMMKLEKTFRGHKMVTGVISRGRFKRNKVAKPYREGDITILFDYGIDDLTSMINWYWGPKSGKEANIDFDGEKFTRTDFINYIEQNHLIDVVREMVEEEWLEIEKEIAPQRAKKFED